MVQPNSNSQFLPVFVVLPSSAAAVTAAAAMKMMVVSDYCHYYNLQLMRYC